MHADLTLEDLLAPFHEAVKPREDFRVGTEAEKLGLLADSMQPLPFEGPRSVRAVLSALRDAYGWRDVREHEQGAVISLQRGDASITLEPAGQLELSGAPLATIHETCAELRAHVEELRVVSEPLGIVWLSLGFHPFAVHADLPHVPKLRYGVMERYLPTRGPRALDMMRRTCTVQANLDYSSEADAVRKLRVALALQPIVTAMFANSPMYEGRVSGRLCERGDVWLGMDPDRSGILPFAFEKDMSFRRYVEWALDVPMFGIKRGQRLIDATHLTFRSFLERGEGDARATRADWEMHLNTLFPEARLKRTIEVRGADAQATPLTCALPALWKGLLYDERALTQAEQLISALDAPTVQAIRPDVARRALKAELLGKPIARWADEVVAIASDGLARIAAYNAQGEDESIHLSRLRSMLGAGKCPAELLLESIADRTENEAELRAAVIAAARI